MRKILPPYTPFLWAIAIPVALWLWWDRDEIGEASWGIKLVLIAMILVAVLINAHLDDWFDDKLEKWSGWRMFPEYKARAEARRKERASKSAEK